MYESFMIIGEWATANFTEKPNEKTRITSNDIFGLKGSATREEGSRLVRDSHEENNMEEAVAIEKREQTPPKAVKVASLVTTGATLIETLEQKEEAEL
jgi:hypothetical protein